MKKKDLLKKAFKASIPVFSGYLLLGAGFGILMDASGYGCIWSFSMSLFIFAGSLQYALVPMLAGNASLFTVALTSLMVNFRHLFYGLSMIDKYKGAGKKKAYMIFSLTDETYSLVSSGNEDMNKADYHRYCFYLSLMNQFYWVAGSVLGSLIGTILPMNTAGIDFVLTALFISIFVQQWMDNKDKRPAIIGIAATIICRVLFGSDSFLIPSMVIITAALFAIKPKEAENEH